MPSGNISYTINIQGNNPLTITASNAASTDGLWHNITITRQGLNILVEYDGIYRNEVFITGNNLLLNYESDKIFAAGLAAGNSIVQNGYTGCLQDIRLNGQPLPTTGNNELASVEFVGDVPLRGCNVGPCYPDNPCGSTGNCSEIDNNNYQCSCDNGDTVTGSSCDRIRPEPSLGPVIAIVVSLAVFMIILIIAMIIGLSVMYKKINKWNKTTFAAARLNNMNSLTGDATLDEFEIHENIYHYDNEDGEDDTSADMRQSRESLLHEEAPVIINPESNDNNTPRLPPFDPSTIKESPSTNRAPTPEINEFIESRVYNANQHITDIDSLKSFNDEGVLTGASSLSTICSDTGYEPFTVTRLRLAGSEFDKIADLLEPVLVDDAEGNESGFEGDGTMDRHINIALVHNYK